MKPRSMLPDDEPSFRLGCYVFVYANNTQVYRFHKLDDAEYVPKPNFTYALNAWKRDLGITSKPLRDSEKGVWIIPHTYSIPFRDAMRSMRYAFEREGISVEADVIQKGEPYIVRESTLT